MTLPNPKVLNAFLDYYFSTKEAEKNTWVGWGMNMIQNLAQGRKPLQTHLSTEFDNANNVDRWIQIIIELGNEASKAQKDKTLGGDSLFCRTLHAMRSYIVNVIRDGKDEDTKRFEANIQKRMQLLDKGIDSKKAGEEGTPALREQYYIDAELGLNLEVSEQAFHNALLQLAYLGHTRSIIEAKKFGLFDGMYVPDQKYIESLEYGKQLNRNLPMCFQHRFYVIFYIQQMKQQNNNMVFSDFEESIRKGAPVVVDKLSAELASPQKRSYDFPAENANDSSHSVVALPPPQRMPTPKLTSSMFTPNISNHPPRQLPAPQIVTTEEKEEGIEDKSPEPTGLVTSSSY